MDFSNKISNEFGIKTWQAKNIIDLISDGNTIPFIARYRKESHGSLDDQILRKISERLLYLEKLELKKEEIIKLIDAQGQLDDEIKLAINKANTITELDDIYRPYRPKRKTRAFIAKEKGLLNLAEEIFAFKCIDPYSLAKKFVNEELGVLNTDEAIDGALDIIAEKISDNANIRKRLRNAVFANGILFSQASDENKDSVYSQYYNFKEPVSKIASHRVLAINRGEKEKFLKVSIDFSKDTGLEIVFSEILKNGEKESLTLVKKSASDAYERLIFPAIEREVRNDLSDRSSEQAIKIFSLNLKNLLMQPPVKNKVTMGLDPGYRTGCKVAIVDTIGKVLAKDVIYITHGEEKKEVSLEKIINLIKKYKVNIIAIGNGTASKETEIFVTEVIKKIPQTEVYYTMVSEAGASIYSASEIAKEEFPDYDVTIRSAISIARRLQDPLAELVKIDPKSIGVGQYQHDMPQKHLSEALSSVVEDCVNTVGVDLNTASWPLLSYVSGLSTAVSKNIVNYRKENGKFNSREQLKKVPKLGAKAFEQCAGFLRICDGENFLDNTAVHPESYKAANALLSKINFFAENSANLDIIKNLLQKNSEQKLAEDLSIGLPTLKDIISELLRPGRDPREDFSPPILRSDLLSIEDLKDGAILSGTVRNVVDFGAFVDIGVHQDGLLHISEMCDHFVKHPSSLLKVGDIIKVKVLSVDVSHNRISLTRKGVTD